MTAPQQLGRSRGGLSAWQRRVEEEGPERARAHMQWVASQGAGRPTWQEALAKGIAQEELRERERVEYAESERRRRRQMFSNQNRPSRVASPPPAA